MSSRLLSLVIICSLIFSPLLVSTRAHAWSFPTWGSSQKALNVVSVSSKIALLKQKERLATLTMKKLGPIVQQYSYSLGFLIAQEMEPWIEKLILQGAKKSQTFGKTDIEKKSSPYSGKISSPFMPGPGPIDQEKVVNEEGSTEGAHIFIVQDTAAVLEKELPQWRALEEEIDKLTGEILVVLPTLPELSPEIAETGQIVVHVIARRMMGDSAVTNLETVRNTDACKDGLFGSLAFWDAGQAMVRRDVNPMVKGMALDKLNRQHACHDLDTSFRFEMAYVFAHEVWEQMLIALNLSSHYPKFAVDNFPIILTLADAKWQWGIGPYYNLIFLNGSLIAENWYKSKPPVYAYDIESDAMVKINLCEKSKEKKKKSEDVVTKPQGSYIGVESHYEPVKQEASGPGSVFQTPKVNYEKKPYLFNFLKPADANLDDRHTPFGVILPKNDADLCDNNPFDAWKPYKIDGDCIDPAAFIKSVVYPLAGVNCSIYETIPLGGRCPLPIDCWEKEMLARGDTNKPVGAGDSYTPPSMPMTFYECYFAAAERDARSFNDPAIQCQAEFAGKPLAIAAAEEGCMSPMEGEEGDDTEGAGGGDDESTAEAEPDDDDGDEDADDDQQEDQTETQASGESEGQSDKKKTLMGMKIEEIGSGGPEPDQVLGAEGVASSQGPGPAGGGSASSSSSAEPGEHISSAGTGEPLPQGGYSQGPGGPKPKSPSHSGTKHQGYGGTAKVKSTQAKMTKLFIKIVKKTLKKLGWSKNKINKDPRLATAALIKELLKKYWDGSLDDFIEAFDTYAAMVRLLMTGATFENRLYDGIVKVIEEYGMDTKLPDRDQFREEYKKILFGIDIGEQLVFEWSDDQFPKETDLTKGDHEHDSPLFINYWGVFFSGETFSEHEIFYPAQFGILALAEKKLRPLLGVTIGHEFLHVVVLELINQFFLDFKFGERPFETVRGSTSEHIFINSAAEPIIEKLMKQLEKYIKDFKPKKGKEQAVNSSLEQGTFSNGPYFADSHSDADGEEIITTVYGLFTRDPENPKEKKLRYPGSLPVMCGDDLNCGSGCAVWQAFVQGSNDCVVSILGEDAVIKPPSGVGPDPGSEGESPVIPLPTCAETLLGEEGGDWCKDPIFDCLDSSPNCCKQGSGDLPAGAQLDPSLTDDCWYKFCADSAEDCPCGGTPPAELLEMQKVKKELKIKMKGKYHFKPPTWILKNMAIGK